jgi:hypothetical protein
MDKKTNMSISIVLGGYLISLGFYFIWCLYFFVDRSFSVDYLLVIAAVVFAITAVYFFSFSLIWYIKSLQKVWTSFSLVSIITLMIFFLIPSTNYAIYYKFDNYKLNLKQDKTIKTIDKNEPERKILTANKTEFQKQVENGKEKIQSEKERLEEIETKLKFEIAMNDATKKLNTELQAKLESERNKNAELIKQLNEIIKKTKPLEEEHKTNGDVFVQAKSNKSFSKIKVNSETGNTDLDANNQEIIFKVQIISSDTLLAINSSKLMGLKNVWVYEDGGLYKYTVGNEKDLKSASVLQSELRRKGFVGAFVVAFKNGKRIPIRDARKLLN